ncbi:MAG: AAA family ATPase, partial [Prevotella sp.]
QLEVDFVVSNGESVIAIEVKSGRRTMNDGLPAFRQQFHPYSSFIVGSGGIPVEEFLGISPQALFGE